MIFEVIGWIGTVCFAMCGAPQAWQCMRQGHTRGLSTSYLLLWLTGDVSYVISVWGQLGFVIWMMTNYLLNLLWLAIIFYYVIRPRIT